MIDRVDFIRSLVPKGGRGLEIGPSHAPLFPKREGFDVEILDHADTDELRRKYAAMGMPVDVIETVDYVSDGRPMHEVIGREACFDFVFSSHAIEHVTDFIGYLQSCERLLGPGGRAVMAIPDKRFVFDVIHPATTIGEVLEAHARAAARHAPGRVFDFASGVCWLGPLHSWSAESTGETRLERTLAEAREWFERSLGDDYVDIHAWRFTPASFRLLIRDLRDLGLCRLNVETLVSEGQMEFFVSLSREAEPAAGSRMEFVKALHREQILSSLQLLGEDGRDLAALLTPPEPPCTAPERRHGWFRSLLTRLAAKPASTAQ